jgi:hypothetical protein
LRHLPRSADDGFGSRPPRLADSTLRRVCAGVEAFARQGVTRLVVGVAATNLDQQRRDLEAFARLHALV